MKFKIVDKFGLTPAFLTGNCAIVYIWSRQQEALYVGETENTIQERLHHHQTIGVIEEFNEATDIMILHLCHNKEEAKELQDSLILELRPKHNQYDIVRLTVIKDKKPQLTAGQQKFIKNINKWKEIGKKHKKRRKHA